MHAQGVYIAKAVSFVCLLSIVTTKLPDLDISLDDNHMLFCNVANSNSLYY